MIAGIDRPIPAFGGGREYPAAAQPGIGPQDDGQRIWQLCFIGQAANEIDNVDVEGITSMGNFEEPGNQDRGARVD
jgi:hypothetical protein